MVDLDRLRRIAETEFADIVGATEVMRGKLRVLLSDGSYIDFWWSSQIAGRFAHHWERTHVDGTIYRHDNMPHRRWQSVTTFPQHFHDGNPGKVRESDLPTEPAEALRQFLQFARVLMQKDG
ncbi:MAG: DUF6516 family protein [Anaerolineae bacterium]